MKRDWPLMVVCVFATVPVLFIAAFFSQSNLGGKHFIGLNICFPFGSLAGHPFPNGPRPLLALMWVLFFAQLPVYVAIFVEARGHKRIVSRALMVLLAHALAVYTCFAIRARNENNWRGNMSPTRTFLSFRNAT